jgi:Fe-Mn family superoxide dismutase
MSVNATAEKQGAHVLPPLPYAEDALDPVVSQKTIGLHYGKHHKTYVENLNKLIAGTELESLSLEKIIAATAGKADKTEIFNNAAQAWNHDFYWRSMRPKGGGTPGSTLRDAIERDIGGLAEFRTAFAKAAAGEFGSGWAWLVADKGHKLKIATTDDADTPIVRGDTPLLTIDVWEHAYYLDYQNRRPDYIAAWLDKLINWDFAEKNFGLA